MDHFRSANRHHDLGTPIVQISVTEAKGQRTELVRRAEAGDEIVLPVMARPLSGWCR